MKRTLKTKPLNTLVITSTLLLLGTLTANAQSVTECVPFGEDPLQYRCTLVMENYQQNGATEGSVNFSMPSMPLAHNLPPSQLTPHPTIENAFTFDVRLDMFGEWMLAFDLVGADAERFRQRLTFLSGLNASSTKDGAAHEAQHSDHSHQGNHDDHEKTHDHSGHKDHGKHTSHDNHN